MKDEAFTSAEHYPQLLLDGQLCFPLYAAARKVVNAYTPYLKPLGLTYTQYIVLMCLWERGSMTVGDLCARLYLDNGTITPLVKRMERDGYVTRSRCREDERVVRICVTERGWALREQAGEIPARLSGCVSLSREDAYQLYTLLYRLLKDE